MVYKVLYMAFKVYLYTHIYIQYIYTAAQKFGISKIFNVFKGVFCSSRLYLFDQNTEKTVILWNPIAISYIGFLF